MRAVAGAAIVAAFVFGSGMGWAACLPSQSHGCVNLDLVPQISREIVAGEPVGAAPKPLPATASDAPYTGPTIGLNHQVRRAPEVGYRWAIN